MATNITGKQTIESQQSYAFNFQTSKNLCKIVAFIFRRRLCLGLFCTIGLISLLEEYIIYNIGIIPSGYYKYLTDKDWPNFVRHTFTACMFIIAIALIISSRQYVTGVFYVQCRHVLTFDLQEMYFDSNKFYYINNFGYDLNDNPDQRITQDIDKFCSQLSSIVSPLIVSPFTIGYYSYVCIITTGWIGPVVILVIFILSALLNKFLIRPIMNKVIMQEKYEGIFRFKHMHVRSNAEAIAFQDGRNAELVRSEHHLNNLIEVQQGLYLRQYPLNISTKLFDYISSILSYLLLAGPVIFGKYSHLPPAEVGSLVSQNAFVTIYLMSCFSKLIDLSSLISQLAGLTYRVSELITLVTDSSKHPEHISVDENMSDEASSKDRGRTLIQFRDVTFGSPSKDSVLVADLSLDIVQHTNLLVTGHSSSGKTSFLRVIKGLWPIADGTIKHRLPFEPSNVFFLSQKALISEGSLLHQILYPKHETNFVQNSPDEMTRLRSYVQYVDLEHIVEKAGGYEVSLDWSNILSPGEMQRLSFVRLFYHRPKLAFLDEATSGVAVDMEEKLYQKCQELAITVVSVGHRSSLLKYHEVQLHFEGNGKWSLQTLTDLMAL